MATLILSAATAAAGPGTAFAAGGWAASGLGGFLFSTAAAAIDAKIVYPMLFKQDPVEGARLNGLDFQKTDQASPANRLFGKKFRIAGTLIWTGPLVEVEDRSSGGKGGAGGNFIVFKYKNHVAVEIARLKRGKTIKKISKVYADGKQFYNESGVQTVTSNKISASIQTYFSSQGEEPNAGAQFGIGATLYRMQLVSDEAAGGPNFVIFQGGRPITISGFLNNTAVTGLTVTTSGDTSLTNAAGNRAIRVQSTTTGLLLKNTKLTITGITGTYIVYDTNGVQFNGTVGTPDIKTVNIYRVYQVGETWSNTTKFGLSAAVTNQAITNASDAANQNNGEFRAASVGRLSSTQSYITIDITETLLSQFFNIAPHFFEQHPIGNDITITQEDTTFSRTQATDVRFYLGSRDQTQDPTILDVEGVNTPAYRGRAYMVVEDLELTDFGNRIPSFEFEVEVEDDDSLSTAISEMFLDNNISKASYDLSELDSTYKLGGFAIRGPTAYKTALQPIMVAKQLASQIVDGKIKIVPRLSAKTIDVTGKTAVQLYGETPTERPASFTESDQDDLSQITTVKFYDQDNNLQVGAQEAASVDSINAQVSVFESNMTMDKDEAKEIANTLFETSRIANKRAIKFTLPPSYLGVIKEGDIAKLTALGQTRSYLVTRIDEGANYILECEGFEEDLEAFSQNLLGE